MTHLHLDLVGGIAGDMTVAALLDAGGDPDVLREALAGSGLPHAPIATERTWRGGMAGTHVRVDDEPDPPHRTWRDVRTLIAGARLPERARELAHGIFERLARAEAHVHGCAVEDVHFHEVGAMDSIVDVVASAWLVDALGATSFSCSSVPVCEGTVASAHGTMPLPVPAAAQLLRGFELVPIPGTIETVTPTGAAILATLCAGHAPHPPMVLRAVGVGMGTAELPDRANALRVLVGEPVAPGDGVPAPRAVVVEATIDDMDPRLYGSVCKHLLEAGAYDVWTTPVQMKKQRPGVLLAVVAPPDREDALTALLLRETTTLGVRSHDVRRTGLARRLVGVETPYGRVRVKLGMMGETCVDLSPEYDDCARRAAEHEVPVKDVLTAAIVAGSALRLADRSATP